ncbi:hypothetical protein [Desulfoferula mesophila]|uniref:50S ribosomal protein L29 n=1 Tax=Desulfoferula mesophila TaxID=3058419 RepID=A0AAU9F0Z4_9BACT|nr:hypothetical protein FAK_37970 [Desulfoferula mesophilus]
MICSLSNLKEQDIAKIKQLESDLGQTLLAFSCHAIQPAKLNEAKLGKVQSLEKSLGISLVAVQA